MVSSVAPTRFAPAERRSLEELAATIDTLERSRLVRQLIEGFPELCLVLDEHRQVVANNRYVVDLLGGTDARKALGLRPGELLGCVNAHVMPGGCGTSEACQWCGAVKSIMECWRTDRRARSECRIGIARADGPQALDLEVVATPLSVQGRRLMVFAARDISDAKRRAVLERMFFHDTLNTIESIVALSELFGTEGLPCSPADMKRLNRLVWQLVEQIQAQRDLTSAERGELTPSRSKVAVASLFDSLGGIFQTHPVARNRLLVFQSPADADGGLETDETLLRRVLVNLIKNAFEAISAGQTVTVSCRRVGPSELEFAVHNPGVMPREVQLQLFQRSFSTKSSHGRGIGTYSVKLLVTTCLHGTVTFESNEKVGTVFRVVLNSPANR